MFAQHGAIKCEVELLRQPMENDVPGREQEEGSGAGDSGDVRSIWTVDEEDEDQLVKQQKWKQEQQ